jgi:ribosomal protein S18 acetylase RimI-like enzyme
MSSQLRAISKFLNPRNNTFVAVEETNPGYAVGYAVFTRLGDDEGAKRQIASRKTWWLTLFAWMWSYIMPLIMKLYAEKAENPEHSAELARSGEKNKEYFGEKYPERANRWHAQSVVLTRPFHGRKIGKAMMVEGLKTAQAEGLCMGLEASAEGEMMYRSLGFELLARFRPLKGMAEGDEQQGRAGGIMIWKPEGWKYD